MISSVLILVFSAALFLFYVQVTCERILARRFKEPMPEPIVEANGLEFRIIQDILKNDEVSVDFQRCRARLIRDYGALTYLLKHAANDRGRLSPSERLLTVYFRALSGVTGLGGRLVLTKMTAVLEYFANVLGERVKANRFAGVSC